MALKLSTGAVAKPSVIACDDLVAAAIEVSEATEALNELGFQCTELVEIAGNINLVTNAVKDYGIEGLTMVNVDGSIESLLGSSVIKNAESATAGLEGKFTDAVKNVWKKIKEWFARLGDWFRKIFFSLESDLKHLEGMVDAKNDKNFNPDAVVNFPIPTKMAIDALIRAMNIAADTQAKCLDKAEKVIAALSNLDVKKIVETKQPPEELEKWGKEMEKIVEEYKKAFQSDPILANIEKAAANVEKKNDPLAALLAINASFIRSGKISELGFKTGADIRSSVTEFAKLIRTFEKSAPVADRIFKSVDNLVKKFDQLAESMGLGDFTKLAHGYIKALTWINSKTTKLDRWAIMGVTRAVRAMYK